MAVIHDNQCREYAEGWNACNSGKTVFANPYGTTFDDTQYYCWKRGFEECQMEWDNGDSSQPDNIIIYSGMPSAINGGLNND